MNSASWADKVGEVCDRFEVALKSRQRPALEAYVADSPEPHRTTLLRELLLLELQHRRQSGEEPLPDEYRKRFPEKGDLIAEVFRQTTAVVPASGGAPGGATGQVPALKLLDEAIGKKDEWLVYLKVDPVFNDLRRDSLRASRFEGILDKIGFPR